MCEESMYSPHLKQSKVLMKHLVFIVVINVQGKFMLYSLIYCVNTFALNI